MIPYIVLQMKGRGIIVWTNNMEQYADDGRVVQHAALFLCRVSARARIGVAAALKDG